jgi:hypothetical protein
MLGLLVYGLYPLGLGLVEVSEMFVSGAKLKKSPKISVKSNVKKF